jgi:hypothetical protein
LASARNCAIFAQSTGEGFMARRLSLALAVLPALSLPSMAYAQNAQGDVSVTIYNNNLALVQDVRSLSIPVGRSKQEFPDVSAQIMPQTVTLAGGDIGIVEQNFDYDLLSPDKLMQKAVGQVVTIVRTNPATGAETREQARVLAANGGIVLQIGQRIEVLRDDGLPVRVVFDKVPDNLRARPTLSVTLQSGRSGARPVSLSYLTPGLGWNSDYVALFDEKAGKIDMQGWITLTNNTGTTFTNANTLLVAGSQCRRWRLQPLATADARRDDKSRDAKRQPGAAGGFLPLPDQGAHHDCERADQAGQLPRRHRRLSAQGL